LFFCFHEWTRLVIAGTDFHDLPYFSRGP
jgi:hypothetical protein